MKKKICLLLCGILCMSVFAGCGGKKTETDGPKPWAATGTAVQTEAETETTRQEEMSTLAALELDESSITLPAGIYAADIEKLETVLWRAFFFRDQDFKKASTEDALAYIADSAMPWGLRYIYDTFDPAHTHGEYEQLSVETDPDPKELFPDMYFRADESVMTFLLEDVFGVKPDTAFETESAYFADGSWYFNNLPTGMTQNKTQIRACQIVDEGHYRLTAELLLAANEEETEHEASAFVDILLHENEGERYWQILNVETFE